MTPSKHRKLHWIMFKVLSFPTPGLWFVWMGGAKWIVCSLIHSTSVCWTPIIFWDLYQALRICGEQDKYDSCPHGAYSIVEPTDINRIIINTCKITAVLCSRKERCVVLWDLIIRGFDPLWKVREAFLRNCLYSNLEKHINKWPGTQLSYRIQILQSL